MNWLRRFMYGRNGVDHLSIAILLFGMLLTMGSSFVHFFPVRMILNLADYVCLALFVFRVLSRNVYKRREENSRFLHLTRPIADWFGQRVRMAREMKDYRFLRCPKCRQQLRAPKGRGKIRVTCQKCGEQFECKV